MKIKDIHYDDLIISIYCFELMDERMYVIKDERNIPHADVIIIDPFEEKDLLMDLEGIHKVKIILTHEHFDHISGVNWLRTIFSCEVITSDKCSELIQMEDNGTSHFPLLFIGDRSKYHYVKTHYVFPYYCRIDHTFKEFEMMFLGKHTVCLYETPGHSMGSISIIIDDRIIFSGDNLLGNGYELKSIHSDSQCYMKTLRFYEQYRNKNVVNFPGHGKAGSIDTFLEKIRSYFRWN